MHEADARALGLTPVRSRMLLDVCKRCGGWLSIGCTIDEDDATEHATTVTIRVPLELDLGEYADAAIGGCRCNSPYPMEGHLRHVHPATLDQPAKVAEAARYLEWFAVRWRG